MIEGDGSKSRLSDDRFTKKVRLKDKDIDSDLVMAIDLVVEPTISWKDKLVSKGPSGSKGEIEALGAKLNKIYNMWKPSMLIKMMDTENVPDSTTVVLGVQPCTAILERCHGLDPLSRGRFARMAIYVNLDKLLVPQERSLTVTNMVVVESGGVDGPRHMARG
ncbi:hypothetical protein Golob_012881 [Gossypium lobatum]|uniref:Uncharacterized protein n=1 Tax=Gossypium lobatum TaxID=34289 RepID=A0A7J8LMV0_9ROSI|nr:hypothetical protein [Gossypium lobatum]